MGNILPMEPDGKSVFDPGAHAQLEPAVRAFRLTLLLAHRLRALMDERLRADGLTTQQAALLTAVTALNGPSLSQAAAALGTTHQNAAQLVASLERKGFLRVERDPADARRKRLVPTEANLRYWQERDAGDHAAVVEWFDALEPGEVDTFVRLAEKTLDTLPRYAA